VIRKVLEAVKKINKKAVKIACLGVAFKADIDDMRESPALEIVKKLITVDGLEVMVVEPNVNNDAFELVGLGSLFSVSEAVSAADIVLLLVDHLQFKELPTKDLQNKLVIDTRGAFRDL